MNNNNRPSATDKEKYSQIAKWAAERGMSLTMHWGGDPSVGQLLDIFESVNKEVPIKDLRWSIAHLNDASEQSLRRMQALGIGCIESLLTMVGGKIVYTAAPYRP